MFAYVPELPGIVAVVVSSIPDPLPEGQTAAEYHLCGTIVEAGWSFDGSTFLAPPPVAPTPPTAQQLLQYAAQDRLTANDKVATRCLKAGVAYPANWLAFDVALRAIANGTDTTSTSLPATPSYPAGT